MMLVRLDLNLIVSLFQHKCEVSETVSTTTLVQGRTNIGQLVSQLSLSEIIVQGRTNIGQLVSQLSLIEIIVQGRTNIGQLVSQLSLSENVVQGEPWGLHGVFSMFRLACSTHRQEKILICLLLTATHSF